MTEYATIWEQNHHEFKYVVEIRDTYDLSQQPDPKRMYVAKTKPEAKAIAKREGAVIWN